jgi:hypothetical protein
MTSYGSHDLGADDLGRLIALAPDPDRTERVRVRCRTQLGRSQRRAAGTATVRGFAWRVLAPAIVGAVCVFYVALLMVTTLRIEGVFH